MRLLQATHLLLVAPLYSSAPQTSLTCGRLVKYEHLREEGKLRVLDTVEKLKKFRQKFLILFLSHQSFAWGVPDPSGMHHKTMCAAARTIAKVANVGLDSVFLWVDFSSVPQEWCEFKLLTHFLALCPTPLPQCPHVFLTFHRAPASQEHLGTRELFLAAMPLYVLLSDFVVVIAPPTVHGDLVMNLTTHLREGSSCEGGGVSRFVFSLASSFN